MKIIAFEGLDKSGKATQSKMLAERLIEDGYSVVKSEFHNYSSPTGALIMDWLAGRWDVTQHTIELIMAADKQAQQEWFIELENQGTDVLILDRYTGSQTAYASANGVDLLWTLTLQDYMRKPDHTVLIDIPAEISMARKGKHNDGKNDRYESDRELLSRVRTIYHEHARKKAVIYTIPLKRNGQDYIPKHVTEHNLTKQNFVVSGEQPIQDIHQQVYEFASFKLSN